MNLTTSTTKKHNSDTLINKYVVVTLARSVRRQVLMMGNLITMDVPYEKIVFYPSIDARDYSFTMEKIADAAAADGFDFLHQFALGIKSKYVKQSSGNVALFWGWLKLLEKISRGHDVYIIVWDDRFLRVPFLVLDEIVTELYTRTEPFYLLQLRLRGIQDHLSLAGHKEDAQDPRIFTRLIQTRVDSYYNTFFKKGMFGYDESFALSPAGAAWFLDVMRNMEDRTDALKAWDTSETDETLTEKSFNPELLSRINNDNYLCWGMKDEIADAVAADKGVYCPRHSTYNFVHEPLESGSDVVWQSDLTTNKLVNVPKIPFWEI